MPSSACALPVPTAGCASPARDTASATIPQVPTAALSAHRRDSGLRSTTRSISAATRGPEPMETTVPTATPASRIEE